VFDIYNVFNAAAVLTINGTYGPAFLRPAGVIGGRRSSLAPAGI